MPQLIERATTSVEAQSLLDSYFAQRAAEFPGGGYVVTRPKPESFVPPAGVFLVLVDDDGSAIGCGGIRSLTPDRYEVKHLYLRPETRGRGLGRLILDELERRARGFGATEAVLDTNASLAAAGGLYRSNGYASIEPYNDNPNATHWYSKRLD
ncbi:Acetyltransferase (GNAT) family protein [Paramicrobacterium humi]|uniref:Acetyltransferase (GNAT) family protein n=1 Tax=Paramicrobacterium humi TaxID=640635 RepID=A0A1H4PRM1_9MICO|nr:GNAT family N-acetyltransferase [Microbacterium humi]SEC09862.1 Acetyltransferase (GNAT) family protein [Microbacterium humi]